MEKVKIYFKEAYDELLNKVTWPTWPELQQTAMIVLVASLIISLVIVGMDLASKYAIQEGLYKFIRKGS
jgi:preprotein translocase subunit SecE